ncbi:MAG: histidine--tRNA ligase [Candidatus Pacebacteria bacterium]|nr:histidine--tRNA ligase [Candidatus Paceibacterota bacterium]
MAKITPKAKAPAKKAPKQVELAAPKGMRDIIGDDYYLFQGFFEKAQEVAMYYGFKPIETPVLEHEGIFTSGIGEGTDIVDKEMYSLRTKGGDHLALRPEFTAGIMRSYIENGMSSQPQPLMFYTYGPAFRHDNPQKGRYRQFYQFDMEILGSEKSILDALIIKTTLTIINESGAPSASIDINSIGCKECRPHYVRELVSYYKKHLNVLPAVDRERLKVNPLRILDSKEEKTIELNAAAPESVSYLCPTCKKHFKEVLEYLEEMEVPYTLNKNLVRGLSYYSRTVFEVIIDMGEGNPPLTIAGGGRYDYLGRQLGSKKDIPGIGVALGVDRLIGMPWYNKHMPRIMKKPKVYFIQLGIEAKLKSLNIIEILRKAHVPMMQALSKDSLGAQLAMAEKSNAPYTIIFGQKEAIEHTVIVRNMTTRSQETVKQDKLAEYLKNLNK